MAAAAGAIALALAAAGPAVADQARQRQQWVLAALDVSAAWHVTQGRGVVVAVIDSGVDPSVSDLTGSVTPGPDYTGVSTPQSNPNWGAHGTWMASLIAGHGHGPGNRNGILGVAPQSRILSIRVITDRSDPGYSAYLAESEWRGQHELARAIRYAVAHHAGVISMSLGYDAPSLTVRAALQYALTHNVVVVASSGNSGTSQTAQGNGAPYSFPADYPGVIGVAAVSESGRPAYFSSENLSVQIAAPGVNVPAQGRGSKYWVVSGTSPACALTAGVAALVRSKYPKLTASQVRSAITESSAHQPKNHYDDHVGFGTVDAAAALKTAGVLARQVAAGKTRAGKAAASGHFGNGQTGVPAFPVPPRGRAKFLVLLAIAAACLLLVFTSLWLLVAGRRGRKSRRSLPSSSPAGPRPAAGSSGFGGAAMDVRYPTQIYPAQPYRQSRPDLGLLGAPGQGYPGPGYPWPGYSGQPGQGGPGQGQPGPGYPSQGYPDQAYPGQAYPGQAYPGQAYPGQAYPGQAYPAAGQLGAGQYGAGPSGQIPPAMGQPGQGLPGQFSPGGVSPGQFSPGLPEPSPSRPSQPGSGGAGAGFPPQGYAAQAFAPGSPPVLGDRDRTQPPAAQPNWQDQSLGSQVPVRPDPLTDGLPGPAGTDPLPGYEDRSITGRLRPGLSQPSEQGGSGGTQWQTPVPPPSSTQEDPDEWLFDQGDQPEAAAGPTPPPEPSASRWSADPLFGPLPSESHPPRPEFRPGAYRRDNLFGREGITRPQASPRAQPVQQSEPVQHAQPAQAAQPELQSRAGRQAQPDAWTQRAVPAHPAPPAGPAQPEQPGPAGQAEQYRTSALDPPAGLGATEVTRRFSELPGRSPVSGPAADQSDDGQASLRAKPPAAPATAWPDSLSQQPVTARRPDPVGQPPTTAEQSAPPEKPKSPTYNPATGLSARPPAASPPAASAAAASPPAASPAADLGPAVSMSAAPGPAELRPAVFGSAAPAPAELAPAGPSAPAPPAAAELAPAKPWSAAPATADPGLAGPGAADPTATGRAAGGAAAGQTLGSLFTPRQKAAPAPLSRPEPSSWPEPSSRPEPSERPESLPRREPLPRRPPPSGPQPLPRRQPQTHLAAPLRRQAPSPADNQQPETPQKLPSVWDVRRPPVPAERAAPQEASDRPDDKT